MAQYVAVRALNRSANIRVVASNNVYVATVNATSGDWKITVTNQADGNSDTTADVAFNVSTANLKTALTNLTTSPDFTSTTVAVSGGPGDSGGTTPYTISLYGLAGEQDFILTAASGVSPLTGGGAVASINRVGRIVKLSTTVDTVIDLDRPTNVRALANHSAIGQYIVTAANAFDGTNGLPANT